MFVIICYLMLDSIFLLHCFWYFVAIFCILVLTSVSDYLIIWWTCVEMAKVLLRSIMRAIVVTWSTTTWMWVKCWKFMWTWMMKWSILMWMGMKESGLLTITMDFDHIVWMEKAIKHYCHSSKQCPLETNSHYHHSHFVSSVQKGGTSYTSTIIILSSFSIYIECCYCWPYSWKL